MCYFYRIWLCILSLLFFLGELEHAEAQKRKSEKAEDEAKSEVDAQPTSKTEYVCATEVLFEWRQIPSNNSKRSREKGGVVARPPSEDGTQRFTEFFTSIQSVADSEEASKSLLNAKGADAKRDAREYCLQTHQDQSGCVSKKLRAMSVEYREWDFQAKKAVIDAISSDCERLSGICLETKLGPTHCSSREVAIPQAEAKAEEVAPEAEKGGKKKKGKR